MDKIVEEIERYSYVLKSYSKKLEEMDFADDLDELPTKDSFEKSIVTSIEPYKPIKQWSEPKYKCPECGGGMCKHLKYRLSMNIDVIRADT